MTISVAELAIPVAIGVSVSANTLSVDLSDGRSVQVPLSWFPRLRHATETERRNWRLIGKGEGIHWESVDEDISVESLLVGRPSAETQASLAKWLKSRERR